MQMFQTVVPAAVWSAAETAVADQPDADRRLLLARLRKHWPDLLHGLTTSYGEEGAAVAVRAAALAVRAFLDRPAELRALDLERLVEPDWFQQPRMLGYAAYAERFGGTLTGVAARVPYLAELGVTYLHLMPLLRPREGDNDGGYAVADYRSVRPDLGTVDDLRDLAAALRAHGISLTLDLVLNHVAAEHDWAVRARAGEPRYRDYFHVFPDRTGPDAFEATLPEVFPDFAPGSFTWDDQLAGWVWTTFNAWQWDLNWHNPDVFCELADVVCFLANLGVECLRIDAIAFLWKRLGTDCQNQPEVHGLTEALRAVARIAAPAVVFKAEAIVGPEQLPPYLGVGPLTGKVSDLAYHNSLMVQTWSALAAGDARLAAAALQRFPARPATTSWVTYVRGHDDIGWAVDDADAASVGLSGPLHRAFLSDWYSGLFPGSDALGLVFQFNPETGDRRISGTAASLIGIEAALRSGNTAHLDLAVRRLLLAYEIALGFGGLPVLFMGEELGVRADPAWAQEAGHGDDNRWAHRPRMDWDVAARRNEPGTVEERVFSRLRRLAKVRAGLPALHAAVGTEVLHPANPGVLATVRRAPAQTFVLLANVTALPQSWPLSAMPLAGRLTDAQTGRAPYGDEAAVLLEPYQSLWLV
jgi:amylosucrase